MACCFPVTIGGDTDDELQKFYKNILTLVVYCKNTSDAIEMCKMSRAKFYEYKQQAIKQLIHDYTGASGDNHIHSDDLV